jgi:uncharacterized protein YndB with AHSA1/START domain
MSIHQETLIAAPPQQVFELLTNGSLFSAATGQPAESTDREGESFSLFGGRVEGRQIELVPGQRVVQAWRFGAEHPSPRELGVHSTVRFTLEPTGDGTRLVIDHTGIPACHRSDTIAQVSRVTFPNAGIGRLPTSQTSAALVFARCSRAVKTGRHQDARRPANRESRRPDSNRGPLHYE